jgi:hypothetical protein
LSSVVSGASREAIERAVDARNRADLPDALLSLVLASFFCLLLLLLLNVFLFFLLLERLLWGTRLAWAAFWIVNGAVLIAMALGAWRPTPEVWVRPRYIAGSGETLAPSSDVPGSLVGWAAGIPLMASATDPANWATRGRVMLNALNNVLLAGPHQLREGIDTLRRIRARRRVVTQLAALAVLQWIERQGRVSEIQLAKYLSGIPERSDGFRLACELGFVIENTTSGSTAYQVSAI